MWLNDFRLVLPERVVEHGALRIVDGVIAEILDRPVVRSAVDGRGLTIIPGLVDVHGDMLEREIEPRPKAVMPVDLALFELDKRLVATGVTTAFAAVSFHRFGDATVRSEERARAIAVAVDGLRDSLLADCYIHARFEITSPTAAPILLSLME